MTQHEEHVFDAIYARRSIRAYAEDKEVEREKIVKLLKAAMAAPSACNLQPWEFVVVTEKEKVAAIKESIPRWGDYNAPVVIVVCGVPNLIPWEGDDGVRDVSAAIENMLIAATAMGLGTVWIGGFVSSSLRGILNIPETSVPLGVVYLGYPAQRPQPRTRYLEQAVHWEGYDAERTPQRRPGSILAGKS